MCDISPQTLNRFLSASLFPLTLYIDHHRSSLSSSGLIIVVVVLVAHSLTHNHTQPNHTLTHPLIKTAPLQDITTDAKYRGICHITQHSAAPSTQLSQPS